MRKKLKISSTLMAMLMIVSCCLSSFATDDIISDVISEDETPSPTAVNISANYFANGDNSYNVIFSSLDVLDSLKNFNFTITFANATVDDAEFDALMVSSNDDQSITKSAHCAIFTAGSPENALSGRIKLCSIDITTDGTPLSAENISITDFTAVDAEETVITFAPVLTVSAGPVVPELTEDEQEIYDAIVALPDVTTLSFFDDDDLINIDELVETVTNTKEAYDDLSSAQKSKIQANLEYNMMDLSNLEALPPVVEAMKNVYEVIEFADILSEVDAADLIDYRFMTGTYEDVREGITDSGLTDGLTSYSEYTSAKSTIETASSSIEDTYSAMEYQDKIDVFAPQLDIIQDYSSNIYYYDFMDNIYNQAITLKEDITDNYFGSLKTYLLQALEDEIDQIEMMQNSVSSLPTVTYPKKISKGYNYTIELSRTTTSSGVDATVTIVVYLESNDEDEIDRQTFEFKAGKKTFSEQIMASARKYPSDKKVVIHVYYGIDNAEFYLGSKTVSCNQVANSKPTSGLPSSTPSANNSTSGGTKYPETSEDDEDDELTNNDKETNKENKLFNDIDRYGWAKEAIEGLYYAGIINGMEEGVFNPAGQVTREQFCKMAVQLFGVLQYDTDSDFADVDPNGWYAQYINSAIRAGYVQGQSDDYFGIGEPIMRQDMATILFRGLGSQDSAAKLNFTDNDAIAPYALDAVSEFVGLEIINGYEDGSFNPRGTATRAEAAKVIWGVYQILNK